MLVLNFYPKLSIYILNRNYFINKSLPMLEVSYNQKTDISQLKLLNCNRNIYFQFIHQNTNNIINIYFIYYQVKI
jgi:hypothetical protein